jgi:hypothetical protein
MKKFAASIEKGLDAAQNARLLKAEIDSVFETLNEELSEITKGRVGLRREMFLDSPRFGSGMSPYFNREQHLGLPSCPKTRPVPKSPAGQRILAVIPASLSCQSVSFIVKIGMHSKASWLSCCKGLKWEMSFSAIYAPPNMTHKA